MTSMLLGLCGGKLRYPVPSPADAGFTVSLPEHEDDFILRADDDTCARVLSLEEAIEEAPGTVNLLKEVDDFLEADFFPHLRDLIGVKKEDLEEGEMYDIADYLDWAVKHDYKLKVKLTKEDINYIEAADLSDNYEDYANSEIDNIASWELQSLYQEMAQIIRGELKMKNAPTLTKYWPQASEVRADTPKLIYLSGHSQNVRSLLYQLFN